MQETILTYPCNLNPLVRLMLIYLRKFVTLCTCITCGVLRVALCSKWTCVFTEGELMCFILTVLVSRMGVFELRLNL